MSSQQAHYQYSRSRSPSMTPSNFIRVHFPNKHTTAVSPSGDPIGFVKGTAIILAFAPQRWNTRGRTRIACFTPFSDQSTSLHSRLHDLSVSGTRASRFIEENFFSNLLSKATVPMGYHTGSRAGNRDRTGGKNETRAFIRKYCRLMYHRSRRDQSFRRFEKHFSLWPIVTHVINYSSKGFDVLYAVIAYMLDVFISRIYVGLSRKRFSTGISRRRVPFGVVRVLWVVRQLFVYACVSIRCIRRKRFQHLVLSCLVFDVLSVIVVSVKLINVVFHVEIVITTTALPKHLSVRTRSFSMCCPWITSEEEE